MNIIDIEKWVYQESKIPEEQRKAIHTILYAIAGSQKLRDIMVMKGGVLITILHRGERYTKDIDFSTELKIHEFEKEAFLEEFRKCLLQAVNTLDYDLDCKLQHHEMQPHPTFPSLKFNIGYAYKGSRKHLHLEAGKSPQVVPIDLSLNEITLNIEKVHIAENESLWVYSLTDLIAEKYRAILQQIERNRSRQQDVYDLLCLFQIHKELTNRDKKEILESLQIKSASRNIIVNQLSMDDPKIKQRCKDVYPLLESVIIGDLPPFEAAYSHVRDFYNSLPW